LPTRPRRRRNTEPEEITQDELQKLSDLDDYINLLRWYRKRKGFKIATRIRLGAVVESGPRRAIVRSRQVDVR